MEVFNEASIADCLKKLSFEESILENVKFESSLLGPGIHDIWLVKFEFLNIMKNFFETGIIFDNWIDLLKSVLTKASTKDIFNAVVFILGGFNAKNSILIERNLTSLNHHLIENYSDSMDYQSYFKDNLDSIFSKLNLKEFGVLISILENELKLQLGNGGSNDFLIDLAKSYMWKTHKILVLVAGNNYTWIKTEKKSLNHTLFDAEINKFNKIFWNQILIESLQLLSIHPRVTFGFISSMNEKNLSICAEALKIKYKNFTKDDLILIHQNDHITVDGENGKANFLRSMTKISEKCRFDVTNTIIIDVDKDKVTDQSNTFDNTIFANNLFDESYFYKDSDTIGLISEDNQKLIKMIRKLVENCEGDVREYLSLVRNSYYLPK